jgi:uncharacterized membrane protein
MKKTAGEVAMMLGMLLTMVGAVMFLVICAMAGEEGLARSVVASLVAWACGAAVAIYAGASGTIKDLRKRIGELEAAGTSKSTGGNG